MKKFLLLMVIALLVGMPLAYSADDAGRATHVGQTSAVCDASSGYCQEVDAGGNAIVKNFTKSVWRSAGTAGNDIASGAATVYKVQIFGGSTSSAGDYVELFDAATCTGTPKLEAQISNDKGYGEVDIPGGVRFSTGVSVKPSASDVVVYVTYSSY